ncbi:MAG: (d)CMP kinase [Psittacicella sp.]
MIITIDGTSGVGKGTLAQKLAQELNYPYLDSGVIYRASACYALENNLDPATSSDEDLKKLLKSLKLSFQSNKIYIDTKDVTDLIRTEVISQNASIIASKSILRDLFLKMQRDFGLTGNLITDGRDMGTVVFPKAQLKIFLIASSAVRANRRFLQLKSKGQNPNYNQILKDIEERDLRDSTREVAPLIPANDAIIIDSSDMNAIQVLEKVKKLILDQN